MKDDHYFILGATRKASKEELKKCYHYLLLKYHPDKSQTDENIASFCKINAAWKILSDDTLRKEYDAKLKAFEVENSHPVHEEISLSDMELNEDFYTKHCRCGGIYIINKEDVIRGEIIIECNNCSLTVLVQVSSEDCHNKKITS